MSALRPGSDPNLKRCSRHGVYYNATKYNGCAVCRTGSSGPETSESSLPIVKIAILGLVVVGLFFGVGKGMRALADSGERVTADAARESLLDPAEYREKIEALEALVYDASLVDYGHGGRILRAASDLSEDLGLESGNLKRRQVAQEVLFFGQQQAAAEDVGYVAVNLAAARQDWEVLRGKIFRNADWFKRAGPVVPVSGATAPKMDRSTVRVLRDLAVELEQIARFGRAQAMRIGEPSREPRSGEGMRQQREWDTFRQAMTTRLRAALDPLPEGGRWLSSDAQRAHQYLEAAAQRGTSLVRTARVPQISTRSSAFDEMDRNINQAKSLLDRVASGP